MPAALCFRSEKLLHRLGRIRAVVEDLLERLATRTRTSHYGAQRFAACRGRLLLEPKIRKVLLRPADGRIQCVRTIADRLPANVGISRAIPVEERLLEKLLLGLLQAFERSGTRCASACSAWAWAARCCCASAASSAEI